MKTSSMQNYMETAEETGMISFFYRYRQKILSKPSKGALVKFQA